MWCQSTGKLSESEGEDDEDQPTRQPYTDDTAYQDGDDYDNEGGQAGYMATASGAPMDDDDEASFDPTEFFMNSALASAAGEQGSNIHDDLAVSDSDEEERGNPDLANLIPTENQHEEGFDIDEYL
jgi:hypothetical protein